MSFTHERQNAVYLKVTHLVNSMQQGSFELSDSQTRVKLHN